MLTFFYSCQARLLVVPCKGRLRTEFQEGGMPVTAIYVLQQRCPALNAALAHVHWLECMADNPERYSVQLAGGPAPPPDLYKGNLEEAD